MVVSFDYHIFVANDFLSYLRSGIVSHYVVLGISTGGSVVIIAIVHLKEA